MLYSSVTAKMNSTSSAVPIIWSTNGPVQDSKYGAGNVPKMLNVGTLLSSPRTIWLSSSKEPIA